MCNLQKNHWEGSRSITENRTQQNRPALPPFAVLTIPKGMREQTPFVLQWAGGPEDRLTCPVLPPWCTGFQCAVRKVCRSSWWHFSFRQEQLKLLEVTTAVSPTLLSVSPVSIDSHEVIFLSGDPSEHIKPPHPVTLTHSSTPHAQDSAWHCMHNPMEVLVDLA